MSSTLPKISIITPSYNQGQYIEQCILSVLEQEYPNIEFIIIDGGSTDNSVEIIKKYEKHLAYWCSEPDRGQSHAINKGLKYVTGDIFNWLNSDDWYAPDTFSKLANYFSDANIKMVSGGLIVTDGEHEELRTHYFGQQYIEKVLVSPAYSQPNTFYRTDVINNTAVPLSEELHYCMDLEMWYRYALHHGITDTYFTDKPLAYFRKHPNSKTTSEANAFDKDFFLIQNVLLQRLFPSFQNPWQLKIEKCRLFRSPVKAIYLNNSLRYLVLRQLLDMAGKPTLKSEFGKNNMILFLKRCKSVISALPYLSEEQRYDLMQIYKRSFTSLRPYAWFKR